MGWLELLAAVGANNVGAEQANSVATSPKPAAVGDAMGGGAA